MSIRLWDEQLTEGESNEAIRKLALLFAGRIHDNTLRRELHSAVSVGDLSYLCSYTVPYEDVSVSDVIAARQVLAFFSKNGDLDLGLDRERLTFEKLQLAESRCKETNDIFRLWQSGRFQFRPRIEAGFHHAAQLIAKVLGDVPTLSSLKLRFGPGATTNVRRAKASAFNKLAEKFCCSEDLLPIVHHLLEDMPHWTSSKIRESGGPCWAQVPMSVEPARLGFVRKNASIFRTTCTQPSLSMMYQLALGDVIAERLKAVGVDIRDQRRNQMLALDGSLTGRVATLDLISASDCKAKGLVQHLLPLPWHELLSYGRTSAIKYKSRTIRSEQFSSMGNGFTFPLMTLILWALTSVVTPKRLRHLVSVYGDDIICPTESASDVREILDAAGFWVNEKKSFTAGRFRESCGADYCNGISVRPAYVKAHLSGMSVFTLHNFFRRAYDDEAADLCLEFLDPSLLLWGPDNYGDGHLIPPNQGWGGWYERAQMSESREWGTRNSRHARRGYDGVTFRTFTTKARKEYHPIPGDFVYALYSVYVNGAPGQPAYKAVEPGARVLHVADVGPSYKWVRFGKALDASFVREVEESLLVTPPTEHLSTIDEGSGDELACQLGVPVPGWEGYKEIRIYTLDR